MLGVTWCIIIFRGDWQSGSWPKVEASANSRDDFSDFDRIFLFSFLSMFVSSFSLDFLLFIFKLDTYLPLLCWDSFSYSFGCSKCRCKFQTSVILGMKQTIATIGGGFAVLILLTFLLRFDNIFTYLKWVSLGNDSNISYDFGSSCSP